MHRRRNLDQYDHDDKLLVIDSECDQSMVHSSAYKHQKVIETSEFKSLTEEEKEKVTLQVINELDLGLDGVQTVIKKLQKNFLSKQNEKKSVYFFLQKKNLLKQGIGKQSESVKKRVGNSIFVGSHRGDC